MADLAHLLERTSRTFALTIPLLPDPPAAEVTVAYLLFRIADTFEDAAAWPRAQRLTALADFAALLRASDPPPAVTIVNVADPVTDPAVDPAVEFATRWVAAAPTTHEGYLALLSETPAVLTAWRALVPSRRTSVGRHTLRTVDGMGRYVARSTEDGRLQLESLADLREYCYVVAGIVGELLTELFLDITPSLALGSVGASLRADARAFGEGLQLVNILKDAADDARDGRVYLPRDVPPDAVLALARQDLRTAADYVHTLQRAGAPRGYVAFTALPVLLARASLDVVEVNGPGAKITRAEVAALTDGLRLRLDANEPAVAVT